MLYRRCEMKTTTCKLLKSHFLQFLRQHQSAVARLGLGLKLCRDGQSCAQATCFYARFLNGESSFNLACSSCFSGAAGGKDLKFQVK